MSNTKNTRLSDTMAEALAYLGHGVYRAHLEPSGRTLEALERRGMIEWSKTAELGGVGPYRIHDTTNLWNVTPAGWAWLKAELDMDRPADPGRLSLEDALEQAYPADAEMVRPETLAWVRYRNEQRAANLADWERDLVTADVPALEESPLNAAYAESLAEDRAESDTPRRIQETASGHWISLPDPAPETDELEEKEAAEDAAEVAFLEHKTDPADVAARQLAEYTAQFDAGRMSLEEALEDADAGRAAGIRQGRSDFPSVKWPTPEGVRYLVIAEANRLTAEHDAAVLDVASRMVPTAPLPRRVPGATMAEGAALVRRLEQTAGALTLAQALREAYTAAGRPTCKHGRGVDDTCDECNAARDHGVDMYMDGAAWRSHVGRILGRPLPAWWSGAEDSRTPFVERNELDQVASYRGVPVPGDIAAAWDSYGAVSWARGVEAAHKAAGRFVCPVCHWPFQESKAAESHFANHFRNGSRRG